MLKDAEDSKYKYKGQLDEQWEENIRLRRENGEALRWRNNWKEEKSKKADIAFKYKWVKEELNKRTTEKNAVNWRLEQALKWQGESGREGTSWEYYI